MKAQLCPVCCGKGLVPNGFYSAIGTTTYTTSSTTPETCRSCGGNGYIIIQETAYSVKELEWEPSLLDA